MKVFWSLQSRVIIRWIMLDRPISFLQLSDTKMCRARSGRRGKSQWPISRLPACLPAAIHKRANQAGSLTADPSFLPVTPPSLFFPKGWKGGVRGLRCQKDFLSLHPSIAKILFYLSIDTSPIPITATHISVPFDPEYRQKVLCH